MRNKYFVLFLLFVLCSLTVLATPTYVVEGTIKDGNVDHDFGKAYVKVSPEKAVSIYGAPMEQTISYMNKDVSDKYVYVIPYYDEDLQDIKLSKVSEVTFVNGGFNWTCPKGVAPDSGNCTGEYYDTTKKVYTPLSKELREWGGHKNYIGTTGVIVKAGKTQEFLVQYRPYSSEGKWNARIEACDTSDWKCIERGESSLSVTIDPTWSNGTTGLRVWHSMNTSKTSGTTSIDSNGLVNATLVNGVTVVTAKFNTGYAFDGSNDYVNLSSATDTALSTCGDYSVAWWQKPDSVAGTDVIWRLERECYVQTFWNYITSGDMCVNHYDGDWKGACDPSPSPGTWAHYVFTYDADTDAMIVYKNGTSVGSATNGMSTGSPENKDTISDYSSDYDGIMDEWALWNRTLTPTEALLLFTNNTVYPSLASAPANSAPVVTLTTPANLYSSSNSVFELCANVSDADSDPLNVTFYVNSTSVNVSTSVTPPTEICYNFTSTAYKNYTWNVAATDGSNATNSSVRTFQHTPGAPTTADVSPIYETSTNQFNITFIHLSGTNITSANLTYNYSTITGSIIFSNSTKTVYAVNATAPLVLTTSTTIPFNWTYYIEPTGNASFSDTTSPETQTVNWAFFPYGLIFDSTVIESNPVEILHNVSRLINTTGVAFVSTVQYNTTNGTSTSPTNYTSSMTFSHNFTAPAVGNSTTINISSWINITFGSQTFLRTNTSLYSNQTITPLIFFNCSVNETAFINFSMYNEENMSLMQANLRGHFTFIPSGSGIPEEQNFTFSGSNMYAICLSPVSETFLVDAELEYDYLPDFAAKTYYINNLTATNTSQTINLYLTPDSTQVTLIVVDQDDSPIENAVIHILSYELETDSSITTEIVQTDFNGEAQAEMTLFTQFYRFFIYVDDVLVLSTTETKILTTSLTFRINLEDDYFTNYNIVKGVLCNVSYSNTTDEFTYAWSNPTGGNITGQLDIRKFTTYSDVLLNTSSVSSASGSITLGVGTAESATYTAVGSLVIDGEYFSCSSLTRDFDDDYLQTGDEGIFMAFFITLTLGLIGMWSPVVAVLLAIVGLFASIMMKLFFIQMGTLIIVIIMAFITIWRSNRRQ